MGLYCCCGIKKRDGWKCQCDWEGWSLCFSLENVPQDVPIKFPEIAGIYLVRVFEDGDDYEDESEFCNEKKNWGAVTNETISNWEIEYNDGWTGYRGVFAWKMN